VTIQFAKHNGMTTFQSPRRFASTASLLLFAAGFAASVSATRADTIYNMVNYPASQADQVGVGDDTISGTLIWNSTRGFDGGSITFTSPEGVYTGQFSAGEYEGGYPAFTLTPSELLIPPDSYWGAEFSNPIGGYFIVVAYGNNDSLGSEQYVGYVESMAVDKQYALWNTRGDLSPIFGGDTWVVATAVPEPASFTLLAPALLGLGVVYLRRRRVKA
jgi:hypothetical protein